MQCCPGATARFFTCLVSGEQPLLLVLLMIVGHVLDGNQFRAPFGISLVQALYGKKVKKLCENYGVLNRIPLGK